MKEKTKKRLKAVARPFVRLWAVLACIVWACGLLLEVVGWLMVGNAREARQQIREGIGR